MNEVFVISYYNTDNEFKVIQPVIDSIWTTESRAYKRLDELYRELYVVRKVNFEELKSKVKFKGQFDPKTKKLVRTLNHEQKMEENIVKDLETYVEYLTGANIAPYITKIPINQKISIINE